MSDCFYSFFISSHFLLILYYVSLCIHVSLQIIHINPLPFRSNWKMQYFHFLHCFHLYWNQLESKKHLSPEFYTAWFGFTEIPILMSCLVRFVTVIESVLHCCHKAMPHLKFSVSFKPY